MSRPGLPYGGLVVRSHLLTILRWARSVDRDRGSRCGESRAHVGLLEKSLGSSLARRHGGRFGELLPARCLNALLICATVPRCPCIDLLSIIFRPFTVEHVTTSCIGRKPRCGVAGAQAIQINVSQSKPDPPVCLFCCSSFCDGAHVVDAGRCGDVRSAGPSSASEVEAKVAVRCRDWPVLSSPPLVGVVRRPRWPP